jgi:16S rRNA (uracil1498-N3)-methyltransferase
MTISRVFCDRAVNEGDELQLDADQAHHLFVVLRLKDGATVEVVSKAALYSAAVTSAAAAIVKITKLLISSKPTSRVHTVYFALTKGDHNDLVIEKCTELGVSEICLWSAERSVVKFEPHKMASKVDRFVKIARSAAEQSKRLSIPNVRISRFDEIINRNFMARPMIVMSLEDDAPPIAKLSINSDRCDIIVGPEGDFSPAEFKALYSIGATKASLGSMILRSETAAIAGVAAINACLGLK